MKSLLIEQSNDTPLISFDIDNNKFEIKGESYSDDANHFYVPVLEWLRKFLKSNTEPLTFNFYLVYFNTSSSSVFFQILEMLDQYNSEVPVQVNWYARPMDMDIFEEGEEFQNDFKSLPLNVSFKQSA
ncbi:MAG TPA: hypothetical protein DCS93_34735 [Microscillaceae bacterium]|nr:hypothetical protein [Microscillaceae bacterium]